MSQTKSTNLGISSFASRSGVAGGACRAVLSARGAFLTAALLMITGLMWFSLRLAAERIFQVDECCNAYCAYVLAQGHAATTLGSLDLFQFCLSLVLHGAKDSVAVFTAGRFLMVEIFWLNILLLALATGCRLVSWRGLAAVVFAATLAPVWDYGIEMRHDNLILSGLLLVWCAIRRNPRPQAWLLAGFVAAVLQFVAFKSFVYTVPVAAGLVLFPPPQVRAARWKLLLLVIAGALAGFGCIRLLFGMAGFWELYLGAFKAVAQDSTSGKRFGPWLGLSKLLEQTPLLLALVFSAAAAAACELAAKGRALRAVPAMDAPADISRRNGLLRTVYKWWDAEDWWRGCLPEAGLVMVAVLALFINPTPFPYNLLHLVPYCFLLGFRHAVAFWEECRAKSWLAPASAASGLVSAVVLFAHFVPFAAATRRHLDWPNARQERLMALAESMTAPAQDIVYDGAGLVPNRALPSGFLHSMGIDHEIGPDSRWQRWIATHTPAVFIPNYRTDWLREVDHEFIRQRYVKLADDFWVLGAVLPAAGGKFEVVHGGRYYIGPLQGSNLWGTYKDDITALLKPVTPPPLGGVIDGTAFSAGPVQLSPGTHEVHSDAAKEVVVVWVGPKLDRPPQVGGGEHRLLFANWY